MSNEIPTEVRRKVNIRDEARCQVCGAIGTEIQHRIRRREGGHRLSNLIRVCSTDHRAIHARPAWALERGYTLSAVMDVNPAEMAVHTYRGWVLYDDAGTYQVIAPRTVSVADLPAYLPFPVIPEG